MSRLPRAPGRYGYARHGIPQDPADPLAEYTWTWDGGGNRIEVALTGAPSGPQFGSGWMFSLGGSFVHTLSREIEINPLPDYVWTFDAAFTGHLTRMTSPDGTADYTYDPRGQLLTADYDYQASESYSYDANGNRTNPGYITGDHNRLLSDGTYTYQYDAEGNRTRRTHIATGAVTEYVWDHRNRLTAVIDRDSDNGPIIQSVQYAYDTQNRWIGRQLDSDGDGPQDPVDASFVYDGNQIILQLDGTGGVSNRYLRGPAVDQLVADEQVTDPTAPGNVLWPLTDHLGTVRDLAVYDAPTGSTTIVNHITYDAYGQILTQTDPAFTTLFAFTARPYDPATGLQNNLNRWYDPATGRWLSEDPIAFAAGDANLYRYVENVPTLYHDPDGEDRRIGYWYSHGLIMIHDQVTGQELWLEFGPGGYTIMQPYDLPWPGTLPLGPWQSSTPQEDQKLIDLWKQLEADRKAERGTSWLGSPLPLNWLWNCWTPVLMFEQYGIGPRPFGGKPNPEWPGRPLPWEPKW